MMHTGTIRTGAPPIKPRVGKPACSSRVSIQSPANRLTGACAAISSSRWTSNSSIDSAGVNRGGKLVARGLASDETDADVPLKDRISPGNVVRLYSPDELDEAIEMFTDKVVVVQCKAKTCRPCMAFAKRYLRLADSYQDIAFFELYGDQNKESRKLMMTFGVKATPTFRIYLNGELQDTVVGINQKKVTKAILTPAGLWVEEEDEEGGEKSQPPAAKPKENESKESELVEK
ncbi:hypothetical protein BSKO_12951 [Bryopsis sp. KO-2023]|nr:hypothetical protein BSKO_12951 [Bryopsis sp. KO-2023]